MRNELDQYPWRRKFTYLVLDQKLDTLDRSSCGLRDSGRNTSHCYRRSATVLYVDCAGILQSIEIDGCWIPRVLPYGFGNDEPTQEIDNERGTVGKRSARSPRTQISMMPEKIAATSPFKPNLALCAAGSSNRHTGATDWRQLRLIEARWWCCLISAIPCWQSQAGENENCTYTPITDCLTGATSVMIATGDQWSKGLRGDGYKEDGGWIGCGCDGVVESSEKVFVVEGRERRTQLWLKPWRLGLAPKSVEKLLPV